MIDILRFFYAIYKHFICGEEFAWASFIAWTILIMLTICTFQIHTRTHREQWKGIEHQTNVTRFSSEAPVNSVAACVRVCVQGAMAAVQAVCRDQRGADPAPDQEGSQLHPALPHKVPE